MAARDFDHLPQRRGHRAAVFVDQGLPLGVAGGVLDPRVRVGRRPLAGRERHPLEHPQVPGLQISLAARLDDGLLGTVERLALLL
jgi:hypothetical protein